MPEKTQDKNILKSLTSELVFCISCNMVHFHCASESPRPYALGSCALDPRAPFDICHSLLGWMRLSLLASKLCARIPDFFAHPRSSKGPRHDDAVSGTFFPPPDRPPESRPLSLFAAHARPAVHTLPRCHRSNNKSLSHHDFWTSRGEQGRRFRGGVPGQECDSHRFRHSEISGMEANSKSNSFFSVIFFVAGLCLPEALPVGFQGLEGVCEGQPKKPWVLWGGGKLPPERLQATPGPGVKNQFVGPQESFAPVHEAGAPECCIASWDLLPKGHRSAPKLLLGKRSLWCMIQPCTAREMGELKAFSLSHYTVGQFTNFWRLQRGISKQNGWKR